MTGRFSHLEFDDRRKRGQEQDIVPRQVGNVPLTAPGLLKAADEECRWGRSEKALRLYTQCLQEDRGVIPAWVGQVQMLVQLGEYAEARLWSDKALELFRDNGDLLAAKAQACSRMKDRRAAYACSDASMQSPGSSAYRWQVRGEVLLAAGKPTHEACFKRSLTEDGADWFDRVVVARVYLFYRKAAAALELAAQAVKMQADAGYAWFILGACQHQLGMRAQAVASYSRCLELRADYAEARAALQEAASEPLLRRLLKRLARKRP